MLDTSWKVLEGKAAKPYQLGCFDIEARVCPVWEVARVPNRSRVVHALQRLRPSRRRFLRPLDEDTTTNAFVASVLTAPDDTYLRGYWQFEGYFADHEPEIRRAFTFPSLSAESDRIAEEIRRTEAVSVHVRRGDYLPHTHLSHLDGAYYARAIETIADAVGNVTAFVSDDPEWCRRSLNIPSSMRIVDRPLAVSHAWEDMCLMSLCRHHAIANSTYSWWGAWLNPEPSKLVVAPKTWIQSATRIDDTVPDGWIRV